MNSKVQGITALHAASHKGHTQVVTVLLEAGARTDVTDDSDNTPLHYAANGYISIMIIIGL